MAAFLNNCRFVATAGGTTDWTYSSTASGYQSPTLAGAVNGRVYKFMAITTGLTEWEIAEGAYNSTGAGSFARTTVLYNSSGTGTATGQSGAGSKINFSVASNVAIIGIKEDLLSVEESNSFTSKQKNQAQKNLDLPAIMRGYIDGLILSTAGSSATFTVSAGVATDSTAADVLTLSSSISKTTSAWAVGTGNGGLDTGTIANNTWYHTYLIKRIDTGVVDVLVSTSASSPTLPTNYTLARRVGSMLTNGSAQWTAFVQNGDVFLWSSAIADWTTNAMSTTAVLKSFTVPTGVKVRPMITMLHSSDANLAITSPDANDVAVSGAGIVIRLGFTVQVQPFPLPADIWTNTSAQLRLRWDTAVPTWTSSTRGWIDSRGKNS